MLRLKENFFIGFMLCVVHRVFLNEVENALTLDVQIDNALTTECLRCICEALTSCNSNVGCWEPFIGGYSCGPFGIMFLYWADAGKPVLHINDEEDMDAFQNCAKDYFCAIRTIRGYLNKFMVKKRVNCDNETEFTCEDVIRMHVMGGYECANPNATLDKRYQLFKECEENFQNYI